MRLGGVLPAWEQPPEEEGAGVGSEVVVWRVTGVASGEVAGGAGAGVLGVMPASAWCSYFGWFLEVVGRSSVDAAAGRALSVGGLVGTTAAACTKLQGVMGSVHFGGAGMAI